MGPVAWALPDKKIDRRTGRAHRFRQLDVSSWLQNTLPDPNEGNHLHGRTK